MLAHEIGHGIDLARGNQFSAADVVWAEKDSEHRAQALSIELLFLLSKNNKDADVAMSAAWAITEGHGAAFKAAVTKLLPAGTDYTAKAPVPEPPYKKFVLVGYEE